ncbi:MAG TPA: O-antigen ligase family protein [Vicinamibacteria bacterium]|nr:O-antigen ligase family protein [Vicinamibacteria bacterium]
MRTTFLRLLALVFLLGNLALRTLTLHAAGGPWVLAFMVVALLAAGFSWLRPSLLGVVLFLFGASFFLYGFHSYRAQSQLFEYAVTALALALLPRGFGAGRPAPNWPARFSLLYLLLALFSLLLLPPTVLKHRLMLGGIGLFSEMLTAFPRDPLYALAAVNRLALFVLFAVLLARGEDARDRYRALFRGIAWGSVACILLGLVDFFGFISLTPYNLSRLFYGAGYQRLQSTFGNPTWFASFVTCTLPLVVFELRAWGRAAPALQGIFLPLCAAALLLSSVRASWLASGFLLVLVAASWVRRGAPTSGSPPAPSRGWILAVDGTLAALLVLAALLAGGIAGNPAVARRLGGVTEEMRLRGVASPRTVILAQGLELVRESPLLGSGYETFNLHLRALLGIPASPVARVPNPNVTADPRDTLFDDAHNTYLQILAGTGALGLACWLALSAICLLLLAGDRDPSPLSPWVVLSMSVFHFYGLFQGMQYIPAIFFLFHLQAGYAMTVEATRWPCTFQKAAKTAWAVLAALVLVSPLYYWPNRGFLNLKEKYGLRAYLPEEGAEFEGFFGPEAWPQGEFRWMGHRGLINVEQAGPLRLLLACSHPDLARDPVFVSFSVRGKPAGMLRFDRPGMLEKSFVMEAPGPLLLTVSRTWRPRDTDPQGDRRELGVAVSLARP